MAAEVTARVAEPRDAMEVVVEQETAEPRDSRRRNAKIRRQPRSPIMGAGNGTDMPEYKDHEFFEQVDDSPRHQKLDGAFWQLSPEDWAAEERHWNLVRGVAVEGSKQ